MSIGIYHGREIALAVGSSILSLALQSACNSDSSEPIIYEQGGARAAGGTRSSTAMGGVGIGTSQSSRGGSSVLAVNANGGAMPVTTSPASGGRFSIAQDAGASGRSQAGAAPFVTSGYANGWSIAFLAAGNAGRVGLAGGNAGASAVSANAGAGGKNPTAGGSGAASLEKCPIAAADNQFCNDQEVGYECAKGTSRNAKLCTCEQVTTNSGTTKKRWSCER